jgi:hypothetical protein
MTDDLMRIAYHETGHVIAAEAAGHILGGVTAEGGRALSGCSWSTPLPVSGLVVSVIDPDDPPPFIEWPSELRDRMEREALVVLAGEMAETLWLRRAGRVEEPVAAAVTSGVTSDIVLAPASDAELAEMSAAVNDEATPTDREKVQALAGVAHRFDVVAQATWLAYLEAECSAVLTARAERVEWFALVLAERGTLSAEAVAQLLAERPW